MSQVIPMPGKGPRTVQAPGKGPRIGRPILGGLALVAVFFGGFGSWAALAPLESAAVASGTVMVDSNRKTVQHLEGGIVSEILVKEGSEVKAGDPLIVLTSAQAKATQEVLSTKSRTGLAEKARLEAERDGLGHVAYPPELMGGDPEAVSLRAGQDSIFRAHRQAIDSQTDILRQRMAQLREQIAGYRQEIAAQKRQLELIQSEIQDVSGLVAKQLAPRPRLTALQREQAEIDGGVAQNEASIAGAQKQIGEAQLQASDLRVNFLKDTTERLHEVEETVLNTQEQLKASDDVMTRQIVRAPVSGTVVDLKVFTVGGVVSPGQPLMDIVPSQAPMIVEAHLNPNDIDEVRAGQKARMRLSAFNRRTVPLLEGKVLTVSADALQDKRTGAPYYEARVLLDPDAARYLHGHAILPGMQAEVMIITGTRTTLDYLTEPLAHSIEWGMKES